MSKSAEIKETVRAKYAEIASQSKSANQSSCCGATSSCGEDGVYNIMSEDYSRLEGYAADADLGLGCGLPTEYARIKEGQTVLDLGSGAGNDAFVARKLVGESGKVIGVDFTEQMILKARENTKKLGYDNVQFRQGDIEDLPLTSGGVDVVISNCVLNLVPNKHKVFSEIYRVLKPGGHFSISDIVLEGELPAKWKEVAELYAGCVSGAIQKEEYLSIIREAGFHYILVQKSKPIHIPDEILSQYLSEEEVKQFRASNTQIISMTVYAEKSSKDERNCCEPDSKCC